MNKISNLPSELVPTVATLPNTGGFFAQGTVTTTAQTFMAVYGSASFNGGTRVINLSITGASVRIRADGTAPTVGIGVLYQPGVYQFSAQYLAVAKIIAVSGTATLDIEELTYNCIT